MNVLAIIPLGVGAIASLSAGCAVLDHELGAPLPSSEIDNIVSQSHYSEVLSRLGPPAKLSALADGMVFQYEYITLKERQYGLILPGDIGKWIKGVYASADATIDTIVFVFDKDGKLRGADAKMWDADAGAGVSVTLIFSAGSLTDTQQFEESAAGVLHWGAALTEPLLQTMNAGSSLESGANGVQLTATPTSVGQHSLELDK